MKKLTITLVTIFLAACSHAQVGINTTTPNSESMLEIQATDKGFLKPRVELTNTTSPLPLSAHVEGMEVYNLATAGDVTPGMYYNDGSQWLRLEDTKIKYLAGPININNNTYLRYNIIDTDASDESVISWNFMGELPNGPQWGYRFTVLTETFDDRIRFNIINQSGYNVYNLYIIYTTQY